MGIEAEYQRQTRFLGPLFLAALVLLILLLIAKMLTDSTPSDQAAEQVPAAAGS